jgi:DNA-directed RNA polymerase beta' subunit
LKESRGEVLKPETINIERTNQSVMVFCERIFGPVKDFNVLVENIKEYVTKESFVTVVVLKQRKVRRDRVGHINLVVPIAHIWYFRSFQTKLVIYLVFHLKLDMIIYYEDM